MIRSSSCDRDPANVSSRRRDRFNGGTEEALTVEKHNPAMVMLNDVTQQIHEGNYQVALAYGFNWDEIRALESLSHQEFHWLKTQSPNFMEFEVRINHQQTQMALQRLAAQKKTLDVQQRLLVAGAPRALMIQLFGWVPQHYCSQRKLLKLDAALPRGGRPTNPTLNEEEDILAAWDQRSALDLPERYFYFVTFKKSLSV
ncbi:hypothetical protein CCR95_00935 [Thiocystis minor]|uniref:STY4526/YPO1902 family pathogenicity island replication protein n=1 Tax=Thiocystis minor TaxID=61597 RepID=UPI001912A4B9|nr:STY4526/YPO1902 family pathogenicity island replication protein [Thiocystis minor]MBK5962701.1 hypothetical protein [Thiocystis minor]